MYSRLQAPYQPTSNSNQNPHLVPLPPQVDINSGRGRFQQVNLGTSAEDRTRVEGETKQVTIEEHTQETPLKTQKTTTTTTVIE